MNENQLDEGDLRWLKEYYEQNILPLLTPTTLDPAHPFPFIQNKGKCVLLEMQDSQKNETPYPPAPAPPWAP